MKLDQIFHIRVHRFNGLVENCVPYLIINWSNMLFQICCLCFSECCLNNDNLIYSKKKILNYTSCDFIALGGMSFYVHHWKAVVRSIQLFVNMYDPNKVVKHRGWGPLCCQIGEWPVYFPSEVSGLAIPVRERFKKLLCIVETMKCPTKRCSIWIGHDDNFLMVSFFTFLFFLWGR